MSKQELINIQNQTNEIKDIKEQLLVEISDLNEKSITYNDKTITFKVADINVTLDNKEAWELCWGILDKFRILTKEVEELMYKVEEEI